MRECVLASVAIEEVWGISHKWGVRIRRMGIKTALDMSQADLKNIRKSLGVIGEKIALELRGVACIELRNTSHKKTIISSRSFEKTIQELDLLEDSVANHISRAATQLRKQKSVAGGVVVSLRTNRFSNYDKQYKNEHSVILDSPTDATNILIAKSKECMQNIFKDGFKYKKTGVMLFDIKSKNNQQRSFFDEEDRSIRNDVLMKLMDSVNAKSGNHSLNFAAQKISNVRNNRANLHSSDKWHKLPL
jgi:DNA polymerase V